MTALHAVLWLHDGLRLGEVSLYDYLGGLAQLTLAATGLVKALRWHRRRRAERVPRRRHRR